MEQSPQSPNGLLASLQPADFELLQSDLKPVELAQEAVLFESGDAVDPVYFPYSGIISLVVELAGGEMIEAAMIGHDSMLGASSALDGKISLNKAIVQLSGFGVALDVKRFREVAEKSLDFRTKLVRHEQALFVQAQQSAACNASQEFLGQMLGVQRSSVSLVAHTLQQAGLIRYSRGRIDILNLEGLQEASCECYRTVKAHYDRLLNGI
jgi:CRP-like cAMP-binding protein